MAYRIETLIERPDCLADLVRRYVDERVEAEARCLGFAEIFTSTDTTAGHLARRGWKKIGASRSLRREIDVYGKDL